MKIEIPIPDGAELIERDAFARGTLEGMKVMRYFTVAVFVAGFLVGFLAATAITLLK